MNAINWFEIPVTDMERAMTFYKTILAADLHRDDSMGGPMAFLPMEGEGVGGALVQSEGYEPTTTGALVYLNGGDDLAPVLGRVEGAGGTVTMPKTQIGDNGFIAMFTDSEGNRVGLHSPA